MQFSINQTWLCLLVALSTTTGVFHAVQKQEIQSTELKIFKNKSEKLFLKYPKVSNRFEPFCEQFKNYEKSKTNTEVKKILIYYSGGGHGHISAKNAIESYIKKNSPEYKIIPVNIFKKPLASLKFFGMPLSEGEDHYNKLLKSKKNQIINMGSEAGKLYFASNKDKFVYLISNDIEKKAPDLIVSVVPMLNQEIIEATRNSGAPVVVWPTDFDHKNFTYNLNLTDDDKKRVRVLFPSDSNPQNVPSSIARVNVYPVRQDFLSNKENLKHKNSKQVLIMNGGQGNNETTKLVQEVVNSVKDSDIIVLMGGASENEIKKIEHVHVKDYLKNNLKILRYQNSQEMAKHLNSSNIVVTSKSGGSSTAEVLYCNNPPHVVVVGKKNFIKWEKENFEQLKSRGLGTNVELNELKNAIKTISLKDPFDTEKMKRLENPETVFINEFKSLLDGKNYLKKE